MILTKKTPIEKSRFTKRFISTNKYKLLSMTVDLSRVKNGINSNSPRMAELFTREALKWIPQVNTKDKRIIKVLNMISKILNSGNITVDDCEKYIAWIQNRVGLL
jgi:hypothetical protein